MNPHGLAAGVPGRGGGMQIGPVDSIDATPRTSTQERLERLVLTTSALIGEVSIESVLRHVVEAAAELIGAHYAAIGVLAPDGRLLESFTSVRLDPVTRPTPGFLTAEQWLAAFDRAGFGEVTLVPDAIRLRACYPGMLAAAVCGRRV